MDPEEARELLAAERARVEGALADLRPGPAAGDAAPIDPGDSAAALVESEIDAGLAEGLREQLEAIERAERRLADGTYGLSVESGEPIPDGRLRAIPWAERTAEEQARLGGRG
jgi:RNA polymerase-binding transcription factor